MKEPAADIVCPKCRKSDSVIPIIYSCSRSDYESYRELERQGRVLMAGCIVSVETPKYYCKRCRHNIWQSDLDKT